MILKISQLSKEERVKKIYQDINSKSINTISFSSSQPIIEPSTMIQIIESVEDRVYFISESPAFEFNGRNYTSQQYKCDTVEDFKILMNNNSNDFFILYNIMMTNGVMSNAPGISQNQSYMIRGVFVKDPLVRREQIINQILDEE
jgi:hypothetical protein